MKQHRVLVINPAQAGTAFQQLMEFVRDHSGVEFLLNGKRPGWIRGRGKRLTRQLASVTDTLTIKMQHCSSSAARNRTEQRIVQMLLDELHLSRRRCPRCSGQSKRSSRSSK